MHNQSSFNYQQWIGTWRSKFEQKTNSVLFACWSKRWMSQRPWTYWLLCTTSCAIHAQCMEEASRRGILGRYWSCDQRRINILSNTIECNYSSRNTSSPLYFKSWKIENWRNVVWKTTFVSSTTTKNLIETRSRLDGRKWSIGFYSWTSASWKARSTVFWRSTSCWIFQTNPIQTQSHLWSNGKPVERENTSCSREIVGKCLLEELDPSDRTGKPVKCEDSRVMQAHDRTGIPVESRTQTVQEVGSLEHRDTASSNANKFNLAIDEENIDFNISGAPNAMVIRSHGINVHNLIQLIEKHPQRKALQSDLH